VLTIIRLAHPIHLHGHDFWILAQEPSGTFTGNTSSFQLKNPARRDVATLPGDGYLAIAFQTDNPGAWVCHCHIAWHASEGLSLEIVERQDEIATSGSLEDWASTMAPMCDAWNAYEGKAVWKQDDSGI
jgi:hypothetical protein